MLSHFLKANWASMQTDCNACARGASKADGHAGLVVHSLGAASMTFSCRQCGLAWTRSYSANSGDYGWTRIADRMAVGAGVGILTPAAGAHEPRLSAAPSAAGAARSRGARPRSTRKTFFPA